MNIIEKKFKYRMIYNEFLISNVINLDSKSHKNLFSDLLKENIIKPVTINNKLSESEIKFILFDKFFHNINFIEKKDELEKYIKNYLLKKLLKLKTPYKGLEKIDANLENFIRNFNSIEILENFDEISVFDINCFNEVIILTEKKWSSKTCFLITGIVIFGLFQIAFGVGFEIFSTGAGTNIAAGFIGEGIGDITFAIDSLISGHCTFKSYINHKKISLLITVAMGGVGAYFSRGAKFSKYGYKIGGDFMKNLVGNQLISKVGLKVIVLKAFQSVALKISKEIIFKFIGMGIDSAINLILSKILENISDKIIDFISKAYEKEFKDKARKLYQKIGSDKTESFLNKINEGTFKKIDFIENCVNAFNKSCSCILDGVNEAKDKIQSASGEKVKILSKISKFLLKMIPKLTTNGMFVGEIVLLLKEQGKMIDEILSRDNEKKDEIEEGKSEMVEKEIDGKINDFFCNTKKEISNKLKSNFQEEIANLAKKYTNILVSTLIKKGYDGLKKLIDKNKLNCAINCNNKNLKNLEGILNEKKFQSVEKEIQNEYHHKLLKILIKTRDPEIYVKIIKEGIPVGIHCVQAFSNILKREINITVCSSSGENTNSIIPNKFSPSENKNGNQPIELFFHPKTSENLFGHFTSTPNIVNGENKNNCLFEAISKMNLGKFTREDVCNYISKDKKIKNSIKSGHHEIYFNHSFFGGKLPTENKRKIMKTKTNELIYHDNPEIKVILEKLKFTEELRSKHELSKYKKLGKNLHLIYEPDFRTLRNHELFPCSSFIQNISKLRQLRDKFSEINNNKFSYDDVFLNLRLDTRWVCWSHNNTLQGHSGALNINKEGENLKLTVQKGQSEYHGKITNYVKDHFNEKDPKPIELIKGLIKVHLNSTIGEKQLSELKSENLKFIQGNVAGKLVDLEIEKNLERFKENIRGERNKLILLDQHLGEGNHYSVNDFKEEKKVKLMKKIVENCKNIEEIGYFLQTPYEELNKLKKKKKK